MFGSDICTCRPYLIFGIEEAVKEAQKGGSGVVIYFRKEGRALGEVTKVKDVLDGSTVIQPVTYYRPISNNPAYSLNPSPTPHIPLPHPILLAHPNVALFYQRLSFLIPCSSILSITLESVAWIVLRSTSNGQRTLRVSKT